MKYTYKIIILLFTITLTFSSCESLTYDENIQKGDEAYQSFLLLDKDLEILDKLLSDNYDKYDSINKQKQNVNQKKNSYREKAISYYSDAIDINPGSVNAYMKRANSYGIGDVDVMSAIDDYNKVIELDPDNAEAYMKRANKRANSYGQSLDLVIDDYNKVIELDPDNAEAYWQRGKSKAKNNNEYISVVYTDGYTTDYVVLSDESIQDFIKAMEIDVSYFEDNNAIYAIDEYDVKYFKNQNGKGDNKFTKSIDEDGKVIFKFNQMKKYYSQIVSNYIRLSAACKCQRIMNIPLSQIPKDIVEYIKSKNDNSVMNVKLRCSNMFGSVENVNKECLLSSMQ
tara:strand:- start:1166 stop:2185 length:1020 start_codon:yes stop_codon:yes gene_type:complete